MQDNKSNTLSLRDFLPYRLTLIAKRVSDSLSQVYREEFDIGIAEWRILVHLGESQCQNAKDLGQMTAMDKSMVSRAIKLMEDKGYLLRKKSQSDNRAYFLSLSERGKELYKTLIPIALAWEAELLQSLNSPEYRDLLRILSKLESRLDEPGFWRQPSADRAAHEGN